MKLDLQVVIPSRKRSHRILGALALFPSAVVWVHESEADAYLRAAPLIRLRTHKRNDGIGAIRSEMILGTDSEVVVMLDDDIMRVAFNAGDGEKHVMITDPEHIARIIENTAQCAVDLGLEVFGWSRERRMQYFRPTEPFRVVYPCSTAYGVIGKKCVPDAEFRTGEDIDMTMQALQRTRIVLADTRYTFDNGEVGKGKGGCQGYRTTELERHMTERLAVKWGKYVYRGKSKCKDKAGGMAMSIRVERKNQLASTK
jgi:hypothetical protein